MKKRTKTTKWKRTKQPNKKEKQQNEKRKTTDGKIEKQPDEKNKNNDNVSNFPCNQMRVGVVGVGESGRSTGYEERRRGYVRIQHSESINR